MSVRLDITAETLRELGYRELHAGDDYDLSFTASRAGVAMNLTGAKIWFTVKDGSLPTDAQAKLQLDTDGAGVAIISPTLGTFAVYLRQADTLALEGLWDYDIQIKLAAGTIITQARGEIEFLPDLTRSVS